MDFNEMVYNTVKTFHADRYLVHCYLQDEDGKEYEFNLPLKGFKDSTLEQCLSNFVFEHFKNCDFNIVNDIFNKVVTLAVRTKSGVRVYAIDKVNRIIQDIEE